MPCEVGLFEPAVNVPPWSRFYWKADVFVTSRRTNKYWKLMTNFVLSDPDDHREAQYSILNSFLMVSIIIINLCTEWKLCLRKNVGQTAVCVTTKDIMMLRNNELSAVTWWLWLGLVVISDCHHRWSCRNISQERTTCPVLIKWLLNLGLILFIEVFPSEPGRQSESDQIEINPTVAWWVI